MTVKEKNFIRQLRNKGLSYSQIAEQTGLSENTIKTFVRRDTLQNTGEKETNITCKRCGKELDQSMGHRQKKFCSDECRFAWWKSPESDLPSDSPYFFKCKNCGKEFKCYGKKGRKYCSYSCYIVDRFKK